MTIIADIWLKVKWQLSHSFDALVLITLIASETSFLSWYSIYNIQTFI